MRAVSEGELYLGMISGTSRDGVDAVLAAFPAGQPQLRAALCLPYPPDLAARLERLVAGGRRPDAADLSALDAEIAGHFADAAQRLLREAGVAPASVRAIGSHGQTVWHAPDGPRPESIQLGSPTLIAQRAGIRTVGDFRRADIAAGGQGAPLAPLLHRALFRPASGTRAVLNLGGIANVVLLSGAPSSGRACVVAGRGHIGAREIAESLHERDPGLVPCDLAPVEQDVPAGPQRPLPRLEPGGVLLQVLCFDQVVAEAKRTHCTVGHDVHGADSLVLFEGLRDLLDPIILEVLGDIKGKQILDAGCGDGYLSRKLARIVTDVPVKLDLEACRTQDFDRERVAELMRQDLRELIAANME